MKHLQDHDHFPLSNNKAQSDFSLKTLNACYRLETQASLQFFYTESLAFLCENDEVMLQTHICFVITHLFKPSRQLYAPLSPCGSGDNSFPLGQAVSPGSWPTNLRCHYYLWLSGSIQHPLVCQPSQSGLWKQPYLLDVFRFPEKSQYIKIKRLIPTRE